MMRELRDACGPGSLVVDPVSEDSTPKCMPKGPLWGRGKSTVRMVPWFPLGRLFLHWEVEGGSLGQTWSAELGWAVLHWVPVTKWSVTEVQAGGSCVFMALSATKWCEIIRKWVQEGMRRNRLSPKVLLAFKSHRSDKYPAETREDTRKTVSQNPGKGSISKEKDGAQCGCWQ